MPFRIRGSGEGATYTGNKTITGTLTVTGQILAADGSNSAPGYAFAGATSTGMYRGASSVLDFSLVGTHVFRFTTTELRLPFNYFFGFSGGGGDPGNAIDAGMARDATDTLAQRRGTNAQTFRIYNTFTDASNYERLNIYCQAAAPAVIQTTAAGTGTARNLLFIPGATANNVALHVRPGVNFGGSFGGVALQSVDSALANAPLVLAGSSIKVTGGHFLFDADNTYDIGASGATRPRNVYIGTLLTLSGGTLLATSAALTNGAAAQVATLTNGPTAGNPTKWVPINDNGTTRYIPAW